MEAVLEKGPRKSWDPKDRASVDRRAHDADRDRPSMKELTGETWAGAQYDYDIAREEQAAAAGMKDEEFAAIAEDTEAAGEAYGEQKEAETESLVASLN